MLFQRDKIKPKEVLQGIITLLSVGIAVISVFVIAKTNQLTNTANLLAINSFIQIRTNEVLSVDREILVLERLKQDNDETYKVNKEILEQKKYSDIISLLNAYEFACEQYLDNKIDRKAFKIFYKVLLEDLPDRYKDFFEINGNDNVYPAIKMVNEEWK